MSTLEKNIEHYTSISNNLLLELSRLCYTSVMQGRVVVTKVNWTYGPKKPSGTEDQKLIRDVELRVDATVFDNGWESNLGWRAEFKMEKDPNRSGLWTPVSCDLTYNDHHVIRTTTFLFAEEGLNFLFDEGQEIMAFIKYFYKI